VSSSKRPEPVPTLHILGKAPAPLEEGPPPPPPAAAPPAPQDDDDEPHEATDTPPPARRKRKRTGTGSQRDPYIDDRGIARAKLNVRVPLALVEELNIFAATFLKPGEKGAWVERVLRAGMARRRRGATAPEDTGARSPVV
jgi:hypothetical protein